jgi:hypothetical protein
MPLTIAMPNASVNINTPPPMLRASLLAAL